MERARWLLVVCAVAAVSACRSADEDVGAIQLAVMAAPPGVACLRITVTGPTSTAVRTLNLTPGMATNATLSGLPLGQVTVLAEAFDGKCNNVSTTSVPSWLSNPVVVTLIPGTAVPVTLVMQRAGQISVSVDWNTGGASGAGGAPGGATGSGGAGVGGATGSGGSPVGAILDGQAFIKPCGPTQNFSELVCNDLPPSGGCIPVGVAEYLFAGIVNRNDTVAFGGDPAVTYNATLHVRGIVEPKHYTGCTNFFNTAQEGFAMGPTTAPGVTTAGCYPSLTGNYDVYMLRVSNPQRTYVFNALNKQEAHFTYPIDYTVTIPITGGAQVQFIASDTNCSEVRNCDPTSIEGPPGLGTCFPNTVAGFSDPRVPQPFNGQFVVFNLVSVTP